MKKTSRVQKSYQGHCSCSLTTRSYLSCRLSLLGLLPYAVAKLIKDKREASGDVAQQAKPVTIVLN